MGQGCNDEPGQVSHLPAPRLLHCPLPQTYLPHPELGPTCGRRRCMGKGRAGKQWPWPLWRPQRSRPCICCTVAPRCCVGNSKGKGRKWLRFCRAALLSHCGAMLDQMGSLRMGLQGCVAPSPPSCCNDSTALQTGEYPAAS